MLAGIQWKVVRLNFGSRLHVSSTKNNHMALSVCRSLWRFTVIMSWCAYCYGFNSLSCLSTCFVQEQLLASSCCLFPAQRLNEEMLSREVMFQSKNSNNKRIQWGDIKFIGQKSSHQPVLIECCQFQLVNNPAYAVYSELKGMRDVFNGQKNRVLLCRMPDCDGFIKMIAWVSFNYYSYSSCVPGQNPGCQGIEHFIILLLQIMLNIYIYIYIYIYNHTHSLTTYHILSVQICKYKCFEANA